MTIPETDQFLATVIDHVAHPIFVKDRTFRWVFVNRAFCELLGYAFDELVGKTDYDFLPKADADFFHERDLALFATGVAAQGDETPFTDKSGMRHSIVSTKVAVKDASGTVTHLVGIVHDVTDLRAAQEALRLVNEELEQRVLERTSALQSAQQDLVRKERLAELGKLAGGVAHEIRNPLTAIKNAAYILQRQLGANTTSEIQEALAIVHDEIARANHIVGELLDYARVREPERRHVLFADLISAALKACDVPVGVEVEVVADAGEDMVVVDATQVEAALSNLIRNAIEAMHGHGKISFEMAANGELSKVRVRDTGPGVAPEIESRLFEPLVTTKASGLGLGLVTARTLVERQGGTLVYESGARPGACFEISLPRAA